MTITDSYWVGSYKDLNKIAIPGTNINANKPTDRITLVLGFGVAGSLIMGFSVFGSSHFPSDEINAKLSEINSILDESY